MDTLGHSLTASLPLAHLTAVLLVLSSLGQQLGPLAALLAPPAHGFDFFQTGQTIICNFYTALKGVAIPVALIGLAIGFCAFMARPLAPRWYAENADTVKTVLIGVVGFSFAPTIITLALSIAGGGSTGLGSCP
jgi:hypothetical protein